MSCYWLHRGADDAYRLDQVDLPFFHLASAADMWTGKHDAPQSMATRAIQFLRAADIGQTTHDGQRFVFVLDGRLTVSIDQTVLSRGDTLLLDADIDLDAAVDVDDDGLLLLAHVADWAPAMFARAVSTAPTHRQPNFKWLYTGPDGGAYFADFTELFEKGAGWGASVRKVYDTMFVEQGDGFFMGYHAEGANNLVVITHGCLELEAAPDRIERFYPGDVCFAVDRTGKGHIDRAIGATGMATIILPSKTFDIPPHGTR